jgi:hypothetical protein
LTATDEIQDVAGRFRPEARVLLAVPEHAERQVDPIVRLLKDLLGPLAPRLRVPARFLLRGSLTTLLFFPVPPFPRGLFSFASLALAERATHFKTQLHDIGESVYISLLILAEMKDHVKK